MKLPSSFVRLVGLSLLLSGCRDEPPEPSAAVGAAATGGGIAAAPRTVGVEEAARQAKAAADEALNPKGLPVYSGPIGAVRGVVTVTGDAPPLVPEMVAKLPADACPRAHELHRKLYRQGVGRTLADVLVTVTEYQGFLPARGEAVRVDVKGCGFDGRVIAMTFGQRLDVFNLDAQPYMPRLIGAQSYALRVAMPGGGPVPVFAPQPGQYMLVDQTREYMRADLFVLNYPTFDVTRLDGEFEIIGIPSGDVNVTAYAPALGKVVAQRVSIDAGVTKAVTFEIGFSQAEHDALLKAKPDAPTP